VQQVLIVRHGESLWNAEHRWQGWADIALSPAGEQQAEARARHLARDGFKPRVVYASDLERAARTAEILAAHLEVPFVTDEGFRERNVGEWSGRTTDEIEAQWPGLIDEWRRGALPCPPGGEPDDHMLARFDAALVRALAHVGTGMLAIVMHGGILRAVAVRAGADHHAFIPNLGGFWFDVDVDGSWGNPQPVGTLPTDAERQGEE
jgi:broad specificity phosphatase PhoE